MDCVASQVQTVPAACVRHTLGKCWVYTKHLNTERARMCITMALMYCEKRCGTQVRIDAEHEEMMSTSNTSQTFSAATMANEARRLLGSPSHFRAGTAEAIEDGK